jgi:hypothetical protein
MSARLSPQMEEIGSHNGAWVKKDGGVEHLLPKNKVFGALVDGQYEYFANMWRYQNEGKERVIDPHAGCARFVGLALPGSLSPSLPSRMTGSCCTPSRSSIGARSQSRTSRCPCWPTCASSTSRSSV